MDGIFEISAHRARRGNGLEFGYVKTEDIKPYANNPRVHNRKQHRKLRALVRRFGTSVPFLINEKYELIDGHAYLDAAKEEGFTEVPAVFVRNRTPEEIKALRLALNRVPRDAGWDNAKLQREFQELLSLSFDMELTGFDTVEIDMSLEIDTPSSGEIEEEQAEDLEPQDKPSVILLGDTWTCGPHSLTCGDATSVDLLQSALKGDRATAVFTDPPYNVKIDGFVSGLGGTKHREFAMASGEMSRNAFQDFLLRSLDAMSAGIVDGGILFVCMDWRHARELAEAAEAGGLEQKNLCVWVKTNAGMGSFYRSQHELVFVFKKPGASHQNNFELGQHGRSRANVWRYAGVNTFSKDRKAQLEVHPTCKPVLMVADALRDVTRRGDVVLDPFLGSGTTLLAAEETGRVCVGMEIDPRYVEVAIRRWQKHTKRDALNAATGEKFDAACARQDAGLAKPEKATMGPQPASDADDTSVARLEADHG